MVESTEGKGDSGSDLLRCHLLLNGVEVYRKTITY